MRYVLMATNKSTKNPKSFILMREGHYYLDEKNCRFHCLDDMKLFSDAHIVTVGS